MPEQREDRREPGDERDRVAHGQPADRPGPPAHRATAIALSCPRYAGTSGSTHGERKLIRPAASATRIVRSVPHVMRASLPRSPSRTSLEQSAELGGARRELEPSIAELDDGDRREEAPFEVGVGLDVDLDRAWASEARRGALVEECAQEVTRLIAQVAARAAVQDEVGEGSVGHGVGDCRSESVGGRSAAGRSKPSQGGTTAWAR